MKNFYLRRCNGTLSPVKRTIVLAAAAAHVEVTTLLIPGENDGIEEIEKNKPAHWLSKIDSQIPFHLTRYFPQYKMNLARHTHFYVAQRCGGRQKMA